MADSVQAGQFGQSGQPLPSEKQVSGGCWWRALLFGSLVGASLTVYWYFGDALTLEELARREAGLRRIQADYPAAVYGAGFLLYALVTGLSLPGATAMTLVFGWYFGLPGGVVLVSFASTTGATIAFLLSRFFFRETIQRQFGERIGKFQESLRQEGPFYLFMLRLIPAFPFFVINVVMGLTPIPLRTYWWVSQLGMLPATIIYVYAGASVPTLEQLADQGIQAVFSPRQLTQIATALALLGMFPLLARWAVQRARRERRSLSDP